MADRMAFPNTMKEFIESFSFKDSEEVYTNGAELIPVFRVEQGFEHYAKEIRAKAIDEFAEKLSLEVSESIIWDMLATMSKNSSLSDTSDEIVDYVINTANEIAERLKVGGENG